MLSEAKYLARSLNDIVRYFASLSMTDQGLISHSRKKEGDLYIKGHPRVSEKNR